MSDHSISRDELDVQVMDAYEGRMAQLGDHIVAFESMPAAFPPDPEAIWRGLPDDHCQCDHWGYLFAGSMRVWLSDGSEFVVNAGEAYHLPAGHRVQTIDAVELVEFSPSEEHARTMAQIASNVAALQGAAG